MKKLFLLFCSLILSTAAIAGFVADIEPRSHDPVVSVATFTLDADQAELITFDTLTFSDAASFITFEGTPVLGPGDTPIYTRPENANILAIEGSEYRIDNNSERAGIPQVQQVDEDHNKNLRYTTGVRGYGKHYTTLGYGAWNY